MEYQWNVGIENCKNKKKNPQQNKVTMTYLVFTGVAQMPISQENMNVFWSDLITVIPE